MNDTDKDMWGAYILVFFMVLLIPITYIIYWFTDKTHQIEIRIWVATLTIFLQKILEFLIDKLNLA